MKVKRLRDYNADDARFHRTNVDQAYSDYDARQDFFARRRRNRNFLRGRQWSDMIYDNKSDDHVTEETYLQRRGRLTTKNNLIDPIVRNLVGQFRQSYPDSIVFGRNRDDAATGDMMTDALRYVEDLNQVNTIDVQQFREALISGAWGNRVEFDWWNKLNAPEVKLDPIEQPRFAHNPDIKDPRLHDLKRWCYLHDLSIDEIKAIYGETPRDRELLEEIFGDRSGKHEVSWNMSSGSAHTDSIDFYFTHEHGKHRVVEIWKLKYGTVRLLHDHQTGTHEVTEISQEEAELINAERINNATAIRVEMLRAEGEYVDDKIIKQIQNDLLEADDIPLVEWQEEYRPTWWCYHYSPWGDVLYEGPTPYDHEESPLELYLHPLIDGEVYGLIETVLDQQKYLNRSISMLDFILSTSAKGVLMIDKNMIPKEYIQQNPDGSDNLDAFLDKWVEFDGVIYYESDKNNPQNMPQHVVNNSLPAGLKDMIPMQHDMLKEISGVLGPVAGHTPSAGTPASLYMQQTVNASMTNRDIFESFYEWMRNRNRKVLQVIQQYWTDVKFIRAGGQRSTKAKTTMWNPDAIRGIDFDLVVSEGAQSPVFRQVINESLQKYLFNQLITFEEYLEESNEPFADSLLEKVRDRKAQEAGMQQEMQQQGIDPATMPKDQMMEMAEQQLNRQQV